MFVQKLLKFLIFPALLCVLFWLYNQNSTTSISYLDREGKKQILILPKKDKENLDRFIQVLFAQGNFAYTLVGSKPVSWESYQNPFPFDNWTSFIDSFSEYNHTLRTGWNTWEKYKHQFPAIVMFMEKSTKHAGSNSILIINRDKFNEVVKIWNSDFQTILEREIDDGSQLLREAQNSSLIDDVLKGHQALLGIVLGYGKDNAWLFQSNCVNRKNSCWECVWEDDAVYFGDNLNDEAPDPITAYYYLSRISCPSFAGDPHSEESIKLKKEYQVTKQRLLEYYKDKNFLEATLSLLAGYRP